MAIQQPPSQDTSEPPITPYAIERPQKPSPYLQAPTSKGLFASFGLLVFFGALMLSLLSFGIGASVASNGGNTATSANTTMTGMTGTTSTPAANVPNATEQQGDQLASYTTDPDGAKHFLFTAKQVMWETVKGHRELAWTINGMVPGPKIQVTSGDHVRVTVMNHFPTATAIHWHGLEIPTSADGVPGLGQQPILPHQSYVYDFTVHDQDIGTHWYHSHYNDTVQVAGGLYGAFIVEPRAGTQKTAQTIHADVHYDAFIGMLGSYYVINGKSFPDTQPLLVKHGQTVHMRLFGVDTNMIHPMHLHGHTMSIVAEDGHPLAQPIEKDTITLAPGETYDVTFQAWAPAGSAYPFHCHILSHLMNPGQSESEMGGLIVLVQYAKA